MNSWSTGNNWYWGSLTTSLHELEGLTLANVLDDDFLTLSIRNKVDRFLKGKARLGKDYKWMTGYRANQLLELRWGPNSSDAAELIRLISTSRFATSYFLKWHVKNPKHPLEIQRVMQNESCEEAVRRISEMRLDTSDFNL
jgi:hypothetical protein